VAKWLRQLLIAPAYPEDPELSVQSRLFNFAALAILVGLSVARAAGSRRCEHDYMITA
jgi:hypothetical protein